MTNLQFLVALPNCPTVPNQTSKNETINRANLPRGLPTAEQLYGITQDSNDLMHSGHYGCKIATIGTGGCHKNLQQSVTSCEQLQNQ